MENENVKGRGNMGLIIGVSVVVVLIVVSAVLLFGGSDDGQQPPTDDGSQALAGDALIGSLAGMGYVCDSDIDWQQLPVACDREETDQAAASSLAVAAGSAVCSLGLVGSQGQLPPGTMVLRVSGQTAAGDQNQAVVYPAGISPDDSDPEAGAFTALKESLDNDGVYDSEIIEAATFDCA